MLTYGGFSFGKKITQIKEGKQLGAVGPLFYLSHVESIQIFYKFNIQDYIYTCRE